MCCIPVVFPVAALFSKTMVVAPATAVLGTDAYAWKLSPAVQVSTWACS